MLKLLPAALMAFLSTSALAREPLAVIDVQAPPNMTAMGGQVTQAILRAAREQGYAVIPPEEMLAQLGDKAYAALQACGGKPACVVARMPPTKAKRLVTGSFSRDASNYLVKLWLIDLGSRSVVADVDRSIMIASRRLEKDVNAAVPGLLRGEREARGTLKIHSTVKNTQITIDGEARGAGPVTLELKPGKHEVKLEKKNYLPVERLVTIEPGQVTDEEVRMILMPNQVDEDEARPVAVATAAPSASPSSGLRVPAGAWVALGVAVAAGAGATYFGLAAQGTEKKLLAGYDPNQALYTGTRKDALDARQQALFANVGFGVAGAAALTAVLITALHSDSEPVPVALAPVAGPGVGGFALEGRF